MFRQAIILVAGILLAIPAYADSKGGLSYTARGGSAIQTREEGQNIHSITYPSNQNSALPADPNAPPRLPGEEPPETEATPASKVWKRYKNLAAGTIEEPTKPGEVEPVEQEQLTEESAQPKEQEATPVGLAGILQEYQKNKKARSSMKTLTITKPEAPKEPEKPEVAEPEKADEKKMETKKD